MIHGLSLEWFVNNCSKEYAEGIKHCMHGEELKKGRSINNFLFLVHLTNRVTLSRHDHIDILIQVALQSCVCYWIPYCS